MKKALEASEAAGELVLAPTSQKTLPRLASLQYLWGCSCERAILVRASSPRWALKVRTSPNACAGRDWDEREKLMSEDADRESFKTLARIRVYACMQSGPIFRSELTFKTLRAPFYLIGAYAGRADAPSAPYGNPWIRHTYKCHRLAGFKILTTDSIKNRAYIRGTHGREIYREYVFRN